MPFRLSEARGKIQFVTAAWMPYRIYQACRATDTVSNTVYVQRAVCEALSRDLDIPLDDLLAGLPPPRGPAQCLFDPKSHPMARVPSMIGPGNTVEEVR